MAQPLLEARRLTKRFGQVQALQGADFTVYPGEVVALIGDNGAGKSTLVKILSGADPTRRRARSWSTAARSSCTSPLDARGARHRDRLPGPRAGARPRRRRQPVPRPRAATRAACSAGSASSTGARCAAAAGDAFAELGVDAAGRRRARRGAVRRPAPVASRSPARSPGPTQVIFMDEPTAALGVGPDAAGCSTLIRRVRDRGIAVVLISHNMPEVLAVADRVEVLRLGRRVARFTAADTTVEELVGAMTGALDQTAEAGPERHDRHRTGRTRTERRRRRRKDGAHERPGPATVRTRHRTAAGPAGLLAAAAGRRQRGLDLRRAGAARRLLHRRPPRAPS